MEEYLFRVESLGSWQRILNDLVRKYEVDIIHCQCYDNMNAAILARLTEKCEDHNNGNCSCGKGIGTGSIDQYRKEA